jgi:hypothetical protein
VALASILGSPAVADESSAPDLEGLAAPRALAPREGGKALPAAVRLVWTDPAAAALGLEAMARAEAQHVLRRMGVRASWRRGRASELARADEVRVIVLDRAAVREPGVPILGATPPTFAVAPFVWVHLPCVSSAIGLGAGRPGARLDLPDARALGLAVGRVIAHEVVHAVAPSVPHGTGLMSASLTRRQLTVGSLPFDPEVALAVRAALRGDPPLPRPDTGVLAAATAGKEPPR